MTITVAMLGGGGFHPSSAEAQGGVLHVLLSGEPDTPTPEMFVEPLEFAAGGTPPSLGVNADPPSKTEYLIPKRATGAFRTYLMEHPDTARARLERYVVLHYDSGTSLVDTIAALQADPNVLCVHVPASADFNVAPASDSVPAWDPRHTTKALSDWRAPLHISNAWSVAGGWALVGTVDSGVATRHPALVAFSNGKYQGGNFLPALSFDVGRTGMAGCQAAGNCVDSNPDEAQPIAVAVGGACDSDGDGWATTTKAGHGTHVAGLIAATGSITGACKHYGLAAWRVASHSCQNQSGNVQTQLNPAPIDAAVTLLADLGAQVINQSFSRPMLIDPAHCQDNPFNSECLALEHAADRGVLLIAAAGNQRSSISFPAAAPAVISAGGLGADLTLWNRDPDAPPAHLDQCPQPPVVSVLGQECGSNFTVNVGIDRRQELAAPAESVESTTYPGLNWNTGLECGDVVGGAEGDGIGPCTGTSMASPILAGIAGLLRSINPLVRPGDPESAVDAFGVRDVLASTTNDAQTGQPWNPRTGYGRPDAGLAARRMLGVVRGTQNRNRAIPLFDFHSAAATDYAATTSPQAAMTLHTAERWLWAPRGQNIAGYPSYPMPPDDTMPTPHASAFVLSTEFRTSSRQPALIPLFRLSRSRPWPAGCTPGSAGCRHENRDFMLLSTIGALESAFADGYEFHGREGYLFQRCAPEPTCIPTGTTKLYRLCNTAEDDCAVFLEHELAAFQADGYTTPYPAGADPVMGYAYRNVDTDGDTLIDGFEHLIGTNAAIADSDGDGSADGVEYPLAGAPMSDPCAGPVITSTQEGLFFDGFE